ncbi:hypothetical protein LZC95_40875 [Pendulispora brunnea]|uniref:CPBP family intramembrane metalloprotease n=1 Tax=Pendulispora brunnea TaxID=2905690 RepID=A0ABZ2K237_9BACT
MKRTVDVLWRFRFSIFLSLLYFVFQWGFAHTSFTKGFFDGDMPNLGVFGLGAVVFLLRFGMLFIVPAHVTYRTVELLLTFAQRRKTR